MLVAFSTQPRGRGVLHLDSTFRLGPAPVPSLSRIPCNPSWR